MSGSNVNETTNKPLNQVDKVTLEDKITRAFSVQTSEPTPAEGQSWIRHQRYVSLFGQVSVPNGYGNVAINVVTPRVSDYSFFGSSFGKTGVMMFDVNGSTPTLIIYQDGNMLHLRGPFGTTWQQAVDALNAWAVTNLATGVSPIVSLSSPEDGVVEVTEQVTTVWLNGSLGGNPRSTIDYFKDGEHIKLIVGGGIPTYVSSDPPYPQSPGDQWFRYDPAVLATMVNGSGQVYGQSMAYFMVDMESLTPEDIALVMPNGPWGQMQMNYDPYYTPEGSAVVTSSYSGLSVSYNNTTWQTVLDALNAWCSAHLSPGAFYSFTLSDGFDTSTIVDPNQFQNNVSLYSNGQDEVLTLKVVTPSGSVKHGQLGS